MKRQILLLMLLAALTACQPPRELPTAISLESVSTQNAVSAATNAPTATATRRAPNLPPTFTPTPLDSVLTGSEPTAFVMATSTPVRAAGRLFYIYNGDSIAAVNADGTGSAIIVTFGVGIPITDLAISPDGLLLAYTAPGSGSAREVFITSLDGSYSQQVSCLGMSDVRAVSWMFDSQNLLFFAAPAPGAPGDIYMASYVGANTCPAGNNQQVVIPFQSNDIRGISSNRQGTIIYYAGGGDAIYAWEISTGNRKQVTNSSGYGADFSLAHSPAEDTLAYLRYVRKQSGKAGGELVSILNTGQMPADTVSRSGAFMEAKSLSWSADGSVLVITTPTSLFLSDVSTGLGPMFDTILVAPEGAASPDGSEIAYTNIDGNGIEQVYIYNRGDEESRRLTTNPEGTITNLVWGGES